MQTAREKCIALENKLRTPEEDQKDLDALYSGKACLHRRSPTKCQCGQEMWQQYIGHRDTTSEWHYKCFKCGYELYG